jgi:hypothetical protein
VRSATKSRKGKDAAYLAFVHTQPCTIQGIGFPCDGPIEAHHAGQRGLSQKAPDATAIPLCRGHHLTGRDSAHRLGKRFFDFHELDREEVLRDLWGKFEAQR